MHRVCECSCGQIIAVNPPTGPEQVDSSEQEDIKEEPEDVKEEPQDEVKEESQDEGGVSAVIKTELHDSMPQDTMPEPDTEPLDEPIDAQDHGDSSSSFVDVAQKEAWKPSGKMRSAKSAPSTPSKASGRNSSTVWSFPRKVMVWPAERAEARNLN